MIEYNIDNQLTNIIYIYIYIYFIHKYYTVPILINIESKNYIYRKYMRKYF